MGNKPQYSFLGVRSTSQAQRLYLEAQRNLSPTQLHEVAGFIQAIRRELRVHDVGKLVRRFRDLDASTYLQEIEHFAASTLGITPLPQLAAYFPVQTFNGPEDDPNAIPSFQGLNGRDWERGTEAFLDQMRTLIATPRPEDVDVRKLIAIGVAHFQGALHNFADGNGRLSRLLALVYWPDIPTHEMIARAFTGSTNALNGIKSFADPNISARGNAESYALDLADTALTGSAVPRAWTAVFPDDAMLAALLTRVTMRADHAARTRMSTDLFIQIYEASKGKPISSVDPKDVFSAEEITRITHYSDIFEASDLLGIHLFAAGLYKKVMSGELTFPSAHHVTRETADQFDIGAVIHQLATVMRDFRVGIVEEQVRSLYDEEKLFLFGGGNTPVRDVHLAAFEDGMTWLRTGNIHEREERPPFAHHWLPKPPQPFTADDIEAINANLAIFR